MTLADLALREWTERRARARRKVAAGALEPAEADSLLRPWLALVCRMGADDPELEPILQDYRRLNLAEGQARACAADEIAPLAAIRAALATARDAALDKLGAQVAEGGSANEGARRQRAAGLVALADAVGAAAYHPRNWAEAA